MGGPRTSQTGGPRTSQTERVLGGMYRQIDVVFVVVLGFFICGHNSPFAAVSAKVEGSSAHVHLVSPRKRPRFQCTFTDVHEQRIQPSTQRSQEMREQWFHDVNGHRVASDGNDETTACMKDYLAEGVPMEPEQAQE